MSVCSIPEPGRMLTTPGGKPALTTNSANFNDVSGVTCKHMYQYVLRLYTGCSIMIGQPSGQRTFATDFMKFLTINNTAWQQHSVNTHKSRYVTTQPKWPLQRSQNKNC